MIKILNKIIRNLVVLLFIVFLIDIAFGLIFSKILYKSPDGRYYKTIYSLEKSNEDILIIGSSKAEQDYVPEILTKKLNLSCWNAGRGGQGLLFFRCIQEATLKRYSPKILILNLSKHNLEGKLKTERIGLLRPFYWNHPEIRGLIDRISKYEKYFVYSNLYAYNSVFYYLFRSYVIKGIDGNIKDNGWKARTGQIKIDSSVNYTREIYQKSLTIDDTSRNEFEILLSSFIEKGTKVYIIIAPDFQPSSRTISLGKIDEIAKKYNVKVLDYHRDTTFIYNRKLFIDHGHLNVEGARLITNKIAQEIMTDLQLE